MTRAENAKQLFLEGYTCSQAVALAFLDLTKISELEMKKLTLPLGGGLGRLRLTCGAISSMSIIIGLIFSTDEQTPENKVNIYEIVQHLSSKFIEEKKTLICENLLKEASLRVDVGGTPEARNTDYYNKRPCKDIVYLAAKILEDYLEEQGIK